MIMNFKINETNIRQYTLTKKDTLIIGAGEGAQQILREISDNHPIANKIIGILDDDRNKIGRTILHYPVIGKVDQLREIAGRYPVKHVYIAIPSATSGLIRSIVYDCAQFGIVPKVLPGLREIINNIFDQNVHYKSLRPVQLDDLIGRQPVEFSDRQKMEQLIYAKHVLITGAGGSIGSEIARQVAKLGAEKIYLLDHSEYFLFQITESLQRQYHDGGIEIHPYLCDLKNEKKVKFFFENHHVDMVFHAAAYKHVSLLENDPWEALYNNVLATIFLGRYAMQAGVANFVFISTDKAIRPAGFMGASKRLAEISLRSVYHDLEENYYKENFATRLNIVRFGNVLGSNGSVIPLFTEQILQGGPLYVTHPEVTRYFMSIKEAVGMVLEAASIGQSREIFILDMGEPVKILDLARDLITLHGLVPDEDIKIEFSGLRPGEKLHEDIRSTFENSMPTHHQKIRIYESPRVYPTVWQEVSSKIQELSIGSDKSEIIKIFQKFIHDYQPAALN